MRRGLAALIVIINLALLAATTTAQMIPFSYWGSLLTPHRMFGATMAAYPRVCANNSISAMALPTTDRLIIGGSFTRMNYCLGKGAVISTTTGLLGWNPAIMKAVKGTNIMTAVSDGAGGYYIGGQFTRVGNVTRNNIARLDSTGAVTSFNPNADDVVRAMVLSGTTLYVGGQFETIGGLARDHLAALNTTTGSATTFNPKMGSSVYALALSQTTLYAGGNFTTVSGQTRNRLAAMLVTTTGSATAFNPNVNNTIYALAISGSTLYLGGQFTTVSGTTRNRIAAVSTTTGSPTAFNPNANDYVLALAISQTTLYAGGEFTTIGGASRAGLAALTLTTSSATTFNASLSGGDEVVNALAISGSTLYVGTEKDVTTAGGQPRSGAFAINTINGLATSWDPQPDGGIYAIAPSGPNGTGIYIGGDMSTLNTAGVSRSYLAALDANTGALTDWDPGANSNVTSLAVSDGRLFVGGAFTTIGGATRNYLAGFDGTGSTPTGWDPSPNSSIADMEISGSLLYVTGNFNSIGGGTTHDVGAVDIDTGLKDPTFTNSTDSGFLGYGKIDGRDNRVYMTSTFLSNIVAYNATTGAAETGWNPNTPAAAIFATPLTGGVYVGGMFSSIGGISRTAVALVDSLTGAGNTGFTANGSFLSLANGFDMSATTLYVTGSFSTINGSSRGGVAAINPTTGAVTTWAPLAGAGGNSIIKIASSTLYIANATPDDALGGSPYGPYTLSTVNTAASSTWPQ